MTGMDGEVRRRQVERLLQGLTESAVEQGCRFQYESAALAPEEVSDFLVPSVLCLAQKMSENIGLGSLGYTFDLVETIDDGLPLKVHVGSSPGSFAMVAAFVTQVFDSVVMPSRANIAEVYQMAREVVQAQPERVVAPVP